MLAVCASTLATFSRWGNFQQMLLKFPIVVFVMLIYLNVVLSPC